MKSNFEIAKMAIARVKSVSAGIDPTKTKIEVRKMTAAERKSASSALNASIIVVVDTSRTGVVGHTYEVIRITEEQAKLIGRKLISLVP